jgi:type IV pilus assembly protein PilY1
MAFDRSFSIHRPGAASRRPAAEPRTAGRILASLLCLGAALPGQAATSLADQPLFLASRVPGNLALPLSVEYPTAVSVAHPDGTYASSNKYLGYFDPDKCYAYVYVETETATTVSHFAPSGLASSRTCTGTQDHLWSGNFLNWATMQTIDPFRWALTGGYRVVDTAALTILEKAWASGQGGESNFPNRVVSNAATIQGATPYDSSTGLTVFVQGRGNRAYFQSNAAFAGSYFNNKTLSGTAVLTRTENIDFDWGTGSPGGGVNSDNFSAVWTSSSKAFATGNYRFQSVSDDGVRVYVNGNLVIDNWTDHSTTTNTSADIALTAGSALDVRVEYYEAGGGATVRLQWLPPGATSYTTYTPGVLDAAVRVRVCNPDSAAGGLETDKCKPYADGNYKPEGLMQQYAKKIRYSVFGYLNDNDIQRDGGVLRAQQKFIGPTYTVPGLPDASNGVTEWNATTGVYITNPDGINSAMGITIANSGVLNYLNKFGEISRIIGDNYKTYDPVSELYYAALRYYKNLGNIPQWSNYGSASVATRTTWVDGFPVITSWNDPIQYACQRNFILGIGDVNSHADKNVPGGTGTANEPAKPSGLATDTFNARTALDNIGVMEGLGSGVGSWENWGGCCNNNSGLIAGLAYLAHTKDIRPDTTGVAQTIGKQTVETYWLDVLEFQTYKANNQFYLAAKYGGFNVPDGYDPDTNTTPLATALWSTPSAVASDNIVGSGSTAQTRPDNYYVAARPDQMVDGLKSAFADIAAKSGATISSNAVPQPQVASGGGNVSYSASWDAEYWTGELTANELSYSGTTPTLAKRWALTEKLATQLAGTGWDTDRRVITWNTTTAAGVPMRATSISTTQQTALATPYKSDDTVTDYVNYLRGSRALEGNGYRSRVKLLGDIVGAKPKVVGPPSLALSNSSNPGYSSFKSTYAARPTVVYVGANDGMLHAVEGSLTGSNAGRELFAYVPGVLFQGPTATPSTNGLAALGNPSFDHRYYVNATPVVYDIDFGKTVGGSGTNWRSVLIGGLGKGGKAYYAIDVTDPTGMIVGDTNADAETNAAGKVLWEFTDSRLGYTYGEPAVVKTKQHGWVVIFASGYNNSDGKGYIFIVNPRTGALIQALDTGAGSSSVDAGLAQLNGFVLDRTDGTADAVYGGDLLGNVWRVDLTPATGAFDAPTKIATLTDSGGTAQSVTARPLIEVHPTTKRRFVLIGSGRLLASADISSSQVNTYYGIADGTGAAFNKSANLPSGITFPITRSNLAENTDPVAGVSWSATTQIGWYLDLGASWRLVSDASAFYGTVTFAPTLPSGDECSAQGKSRIYSMDFDSGRTELLNGTTDVAYVETTSLVNEIQNLSESGTRRLTVGLSDGTLLRPSTRPMAAQPLRRLNWRELPVAN